MLDAVGSVRQLADASGSVTLSQSFDPFGSLRSQSGASASSYGFAGEWTDATGLQHLRARYYSPQQGKFLTSDPFPGFMGMPQTQNRYAYALNNPILYTDPSGEFVFLPLMIAAVAGGAIGGLAYYGLQLLYPMPPALIGIGCRRLCGAAQEPFLELLWGLESMAASGLAHN